MTNSRTIFDRLRNFLATEIRMSHVYQPVMIRELLRRGGTASTEAIARALLAERDGDAIDPEGGVRGVIPDKQHYR